MLFILRLMALNNTILKSHVCYLCFLIWAVYKTCLTFHVSIVEAFKRHLLVEWTNVCRAKVVEEFMVKGSATCDFVRNKHAI